MPGQGNQAFSGGRSRHNPFLNNDENYRRLSAQMEMPPQDLTIFTNEEKSKGDRLDAVEKRLDKLEGCQSSLIHIATPLEIKQFS